MTVTHDEFEQLVQEALDTLPQQLAERIDNVRIIIEEQPDEATVRKMQLPGPWALLGLYEGIPLNKRGTWYGMSAVVPDTITLYSKNIQNAVRSRAELQEQIRATLIHEIAHYYGMDEDEVRAAGY